MILPKLKEGKVILCDRFNDSTIAYQGAGRGLGIEYVKNICHAITGPLQPELTLLLDIPAKEGLIRAKKALKEWDQDRFESEAIQFHEKIREAYLALAKEDPKRVRILDATQPFESVSRLVLSTILEVLQPHAV